MFETNKKMEEYIRKDLKKIFFPDENVYKFSMYDKNKKEYIVDIDNKNGEDLKISRENWSEKKILALITKHIEKENVLDYSENCIIDQDEDGFGITYKTTINTTDHKFYIEAY